MLLLLDHYDSFTLNLARYFTILGVSSRIVQHDQIDGQTVDLSGFRGLVLSPGPGRPEQAHTAHQVLARYAGQLPILGICLGHQVIAHAFGASIIQAPRPMHGYRSLLEHQGRGLFSGLPTHFAVTRYHSLIVDAQSLPATLEVTAKTAEDHLVMGLRHKTLAIEGVQFHPEALLTEQGLALLQNFVSQLYG
ncbi:MAG: aminodeoxychorismate/anthranilate synthase component II [Eubacteriales bacterium]|nr:aminodeoxychorismate/anthranilate synthase component II [Eubacteriales bacterium]